MLHQHCLERNFPTNSILFAMSEVNTVLEHEFVENKSSRWKIPYHVICCWFFSYRGVLRSIKSYLQLPWVIFILIILLINNWKILFICLAVREWIQNSYLLCPLRAHELFRACRPYRHGEPDILKVRLPRFKTSDNFNVKVNEIS